MEDYNKVKNHILKIYLNDDTLHIIKKEAIKKLLKQTECALIETKKEEDLKLKEWMKNGWLNKLITQAKQISEFENLDVLENLNYFADFEDEGNNLFYENFIELYFELKAFKDSGIDESNYTKEIQSLEKKREELQKFSSKPIELDKIPNQPADIILRFMDSNFNEDVEYEDYGEGSEWICHKDNALKIINSIISSLQLRFKGEYKKRPHKTAQAKKNILIENEFRTFVFKHIRGELSKKEIEDGNIKFSKFGWLPLDLIKNT